MQSVGPYAFSKPIGSGAFAQVWECRHMFTGEKFACKIVPISSCLDPEYFPHFKNELIIYSRINHPSINHIKDLIVNSDNVYIIQELCEGGDLNEIVQKSGGLSEIQAKHYFAQIMHAISYIHSQNIAHRDIKLDNILITSDNNIKLTDFGLSKEMSPDSPLYTMCGTFVYVAPEIIKGLPYTLSADIWSSGVLLYSMVANHFPWTLDGDIPQEQIMQIVSQQIIDGYIEYPDTFSYELNELLSSILDVDPEKRPTADEILQHPWFDGEPDNNLEGFSPEPDPKIIGLVTTFLSELETKVPHQ